MSLLIGMKLKKKKSIVLLLHLISVQFTTGSRRDDLGIEKWFSENTINSTFDMGLKTVWIGQKKIVTDQVINKNHKRNKLTDKHDEV